MIHSSKLGKLMPTRESLVAETLVNLADTLVAGYDVTEMFYYLVESCTEVLSIGHAGLLLVDTAGDLQVVAATSEVAHLIELLQIQNQEGPCLDAFRTGEPVESGPLDAPAAIERWPILSEAAHQAGFGAITALPMRLRNQVLGALNLFRIDSDELSSVDQAVAQAFANIATISVIQARTTHDARGVIDQLQRALDTRIVIEQAKGYLAQHAQVSTDQAFGRIRRYARDHNLQLSAVARDIVSGKLDSQRLADRPVDSSETPV